MKTYSQKKLLLAAIKKWNLILKGRQDSFIFFILIIISFPVSAQVVLFDFDSIPRYTPFPTGYTVSGVTTHLSGTGSSYSIQDANVLGFTPAGFSGHVVYPNSINLSDLLIGFDQKLTDFSIMYSVQELACDTSATMRVTAYMNGSYVGTNTKIALHPGTWPVDTLRCSFIAGFDSVVVHYDSHPPTCLDYGVVFMADNMRVTPYSTGIQGQHTFIERFSVTNPVSQSAIISFSLSQSESISLTVYDMTGRVIKNLFQGSLTAGEHQLIWDVHDVAFGDGMYVLKVTEMNATRFCKLVVVK